MRNQRGIAVVVGLLIGGLAAVGMPSVGAISYPNPRPGPGAVSRTTHTLEVVTSGSGSGKVISSPGGINCTTGSPAECQREFPAGTQILLHAEPLQGSTFGAWSNCPAPTANECQLRLDSDTVIGASFDRPGPSAQRIDKTLRLVAKPKRVKKGKNTNLTGIIRPCTPQTQNDFVQFFVRGTLVASIPVSPECEADLAWRLKRSSVFRAVSPADGESESVESRKVKVRERRERRPRARGNGS